MKPLQSVDIFSVFQIFLTCTFIQQTESICRKDQIESCKQAAKSDQLDQFHAGGTCKPKHYVQFTHVCTVDNYLPSTDYCCCVTDKKVLCCRYQQGWATFRCTQSEDTIDKVPLKSFPVWLLALVIVGPIVLLICCAVCIVKCCCYKYDSDDNEKCDIPCFRSCERKSSEKSSSGYSATRTDEVARGNNNPLDSLASGKVIGSQFSTESTSSETKLLPQMDDPITPASAPPIEDSSAYATYNTDNTTCQHKHNHHGYSRLESEISATGVVPYTDSNRSMSTSASIVTNQSGGGGFPCPNCSAAMPSCPPPTYDEHRRDRIIT